MTDPILITGCARSGTSMVAGVLNICGAFSGKTFGPNKNNEKGMFENGSIINKLVKPYLRDIKADPMGQFPLPDTATINIPSDWKDKVETIMETEGYQGGPWMVKDAKMALMWPVWHYAFPNAKWVIVRRATPDIVKSCLKTGFMKAFSKKDIQEKIGVNSEEEGWKWWVHQHQNRFIEIYSQGLNVQTVWPERLVYANYQQMKDTVEWLGLEWKGEEVAKFIEPKLWKARKRQTVAEFKESKNINGQIMSEFLNNQDYAENDSAES